MTATTVSVPRQRTAGARGTPGAPSVPRQARRADTPKRRVGHGVARPALRLTRRGRLAMTLSLLLVMGVGALLFSTRSMATDEPGSGETTRTVVVERGDTLWQIAATVAAPGEVREMIHRIEKLNALPGPALAEGQEIAVPVG